MVWRLTQDHRGLPEGACLSEQAYKGIFYVDKPMWEIIQDFEISDMIKYEDEIYCRNLGIEYFLFYNDSELDEFINKQYDLRTVN